MKQEEILSVCLSETSRDPIAILEKLMSLPSCRMHGPEHHILVGSALLTAYKNAGGKVDLPAALGEMAVRGSAVPGGTCGMWGACGAGISTGQFLSIVSASGPLAVDAWAPCIRMTACCLENIARFGGPRCCKRDSYLALLAAAEFVRKNLNIPMETATPVCSRSSLNEQCLGEKCPFFPMEEKP